MYLLCVCSLILIPDGAERLVVGAAVGLQKPGHTVEIYTSYHDPAHCFDETRDGVGFPKRLLQPVEFDL